MRLHLTTYSLIGGTYAVDAGDMSARFIKVQIVDLKSIYYNSLLERISKISPHPCLCRFFHTAYLCKTGYVLDVFFMWL